MERRIELESQHSSMLRKMQSHEKLQRKSKFYQRESQMLKLENTQGIDNLGTSHYGSVMSQE